MSEETRAGAAAVIQQLFGAGYEQRKTGLAKELLDVVEETLFGVVYNRPGLELRERSLVTISVLSALGRENQLRNHVRGALNAGLSRQAITEALLQTAFYAGVPAGLNALRTAEAVFSEIDREDAERKATT